MARPNPSGGYSYGQLEGLWIAAGGPRRLAPLMAAIAMAESGGDPRAHNPSGATGLWQILGNPGPGNAYDPFTNARFAVMKWKSQGLGAWVTYTQGTYKRYLKRGVPPQDPAGVASAPVGFNYRDPFRGLKGATPERIDMGVDEGGSGPVYALAPGRITSARTGTGWGPPAGASPGGFIGERITEGPLKGKFVYVAEGVYPQVKVGQRVGPGTVIGRATGGGIETGLAAPPGTGDALAAQLGEYGTDGTVTAAGVAYARILRASGAKTVPIPKSGAGESGAPTWLKDILHSVSLITDTGPGPLTGLGGVASAIGGISDWLNGLSAAIDWLLNPANWVRVLCGIAGGFLALGGVVVLSHVGGDIPGSQAIGGVSARPAALPIGILMVGAGGVLLFVAFHNLAGNPANLAELLGDLQGSAQTAAAQ